MDDKLLPKTFENLKSLKKGDIIIEMAYGMMARSEVISEVKLQFSGTDKQLVWKGKNTETGETIDFLCTEGFLHYSDIEGIIKKEEKDG